jgi:hypothetical protein
MAAPRKQVHRPRSSGGLRVTADRTTVRDRGRIKAGIKSRAS